MAIRRRRQVRTAVLDVADADAVAALFEDLDALDVLVNGAGIVSTDTGRAHAGRALGRGLRHQRARRRS